jgi:hypothetical protein
MSRNCDPLVNEANRRHAWNSAVIEMAAAMGCNTRPANESGYIGIAFEHVGTAAEYHGPDRADTDELLRIIAEQARTIRQLRQEAADA